MFYIISFSDGRIVGDNFSCSYRECQKYANSISHGHEFNIEEYDSENSYLNEM